jgi:hypothetical protein
MPTKAAQPKKKIKTLADFAAVIQKDYGALSEKITTVEQSISGKMATKVDLDGVKATLKDIREDVKYVKEYMVSKTDLESAIKDEFGKSEHGKRIDDLRTRVEQIEHKLGIQRKHQTAA